jgi:hypothetical protein
MDDLKHFPVRADKPGRRSRNYIIRAAAKRYANSHHALDAGCRAEHEKTLRQELPVPDRPGRPRSRRARIAWDEDGRDLAKADVPLPSDRHRRRPSLEREDAFRDATTVKRRQLSDDAQVAELYRMGILYDDEEQPLSLDSIKRDDIYSIRQKPLRKARPGKHVHQSRLDLSFTDLGDASSPIRVIYELATATPSYDVDTSQPPELVDDMSDYDCLSEAELEDAEMPSREVFADEPPTDAWIMLGDGS